MFKNFLKKKFLTACHDAGGANQIYHYLKKNKIIYKSYLAGPAVKIFKKKTNLDLLNLEKAIEDSDIVILGSGTGNFELDVLKKAKDKNKYTIVFLDNWTNFFKRFKRKKVFYLPDEIYVSDKYSFNIARNKIKNVKIKRVKNYYLDYIKKKSSNNLKKKLCIYFSPNYDNSIKNLKLKKKVDIKNFNILLKKEEKIKKILNSKIFDFDILPHPGEKENKYKKFKNKDDKKINILQNQKLENIITKYKFSISTNSYSLFISKMCGLKTINNIIGTNIKRSIPKEYIDYEI